MYNIQMPNKQDNNNKISQAYRIKMLNITCLINIKFKTTFKCNISKDLTVLNLLLKAVLMKTRMKIL